MGRQELVAQVGTAKANWAPVLGVVSECLPSCHRQVPDRRTSLLGLLTIPRQRIASGCSMRGTNRDHRQPVQRQRAVAPSDHGDRAALIVAITLRSNHHRQSQARDDAAQVWVWRRSVRRLIDLRRLSLGRLNDKGAVARALAAMDREMDTRRYTKPRPSTRLSRKRACHDDASVQQGQVDNPGATSAPVHLTCCRGTTARNMRDNALLTNDASAKRPSAPGRHGRTPRNVASR